ncbi:aminomethyl-transferring glycine dehydrogenase [Planosporangium mesophilum]|uniref:Glycine dehydrogenase (decarboxylating) n=1 Tax=Planosporangium mesophilum TaxID=689768 RepID=A0A8J3TD61_9ACTN|nr:aminomethyl-transferring glycine dehydrogenase [Planosporangium mesophilum]NJC86159.1 aminomethyl-transferring glycine dehydrogenase [Planosporangium mesophilum]GII22992.1 glycine dehydrogenase (decarboxylating) [Planosporangium mesophilum]
MTDPIELARSDAFARRHIGASADEQRRMLETIGYGSIDELMTAAIPEVIRWHGTLDLPAAATEAEAIAELRALAERNRPMVSMIGLGYHGTHTPAVIRRNVLESPAWYTAYTPYQPEISQGRLEALLNFQTVIADLTGLPVAGASLLDEATAAAEAMTLARRAGKAKSNVYVVDADTLPQTIAVLATRAEPLGIEVRVVDVERDELPSEFYGLHLQYPGASGAVRDHAALIAAAHERGALVAVAADLLALCLLREPGAIGADIAVGSAQRFGVPMGFGGPHAGYMSVRAGLERMLPGRLVGVSRDADGSAAYRLALQTREQHIRREKATSNICTAQVLLAVIASMYAVYHGPEGLRAIARRTHDVAARLAAGLTAGGVELAHGAFFDTLTAVVPGRADEVVAAAAGRGVNLRRIDVDRVGISCDETTTDEHLAAVWGAFDVTGVEAGSEVLPAGLGRTSDYLTNPVFSAHHSETAMLRYLRRLSDKDYALDRGMIPLGSCTMKLNATTEMEPITWSEFAELHPFAPAEQTEGYRQLVADLERWLAEVTGYDAVSLQPNAGSQGEFAGLLAIRSYHRDRGDDHRDVCLIPSSAHGTNAASAVMAGMRVVVVACDGDGNVDLVDLDRKIEQQRDRLAAIMVTYPSTHGVYETGIAELCAKVHDAGGQVYVDGANLNALLGFAKPGQFGADVSHLNLHKTFCIPHGGGGPGVGPVAVRSHLAPFLPGHPLHAEKGVGPVAAAPQGSAGILPIPWAYLRMMGPEGLAQATGVAVLSANYVAARLRDHYPVLYAGNKGLVAHECILDLRPITKASGVTVDDVAKRLIDYGFHAPTMSFPVAGTLMVEPTESEDLAELDRFCDAMIAIRGEIDRVAAGEWPAGDNPLANAPHTASMVTADDWPHPYPRSLAAYPGGGDRSAKYWPPVRRIDGAYGDRNLVCSCPSPAAYE